MSLPEIQPRRWNGVEWTPDQPSSASRVHGSHVDPVVLALETPSGRLVAAQGDEDGLLQVAGIGGGGGGGAATIADGDDVAEGATTDAKVTGDNIGTLSAKLRGLSYLLNLCIDTVNNWLKVSIQNATLAVTQSGTWTVSGPLTDTELRATAVPVSLATVPSHAVTNAGTFAVQDAAAEASLSVLDDWDESDRAKVNPIVGQAGVAAGAGAVGATVQRVTLASDDPAVTSLGLIDDAVVADDAAFTPATTKVVMAGFQADESSTDSVNEGDAGAARMTLDRKLIVTVEPHTAGGWSIFNATSGDGSTALTNSAQSVKGSAGKLGGWYIYNPNSSAAYVVIYNVASGSVTVGTTNPAMVLAIPATSAANLELVNGLTFDTAISVAAATTAGGNTAPSTALEANFWYL